MILNGIWDPEALEELLQGKGDDATGSKKEVTVGRQQRTLNYVYSSDDYMSSGSEEDSEIEEEDEGNKRAPLCNASSQHLTQSSLVTANTNNFTKNNTSPTLKIVKQSSSHEEEAKKNTTTFNFALDQPLDIESQKNLEYKWFGNKKSIKSEKPNVSQYQTQQTYSSQIVTSASQI